MAPFLGPLPQVASFRGGGAVSLCAPPPAPYPTHFPAPSVLHPLAFLPRQVRHKLKVLGVGSLEALRAHDQKALLKRGFTKPQAKRLVEIGRVAHVAGLEGADLGGAAT